MFEFFSERILKKKSAKNYFWRKNFQNKKKIGTEKCEDFPRFRKFY